jgi:hypothetical protein
MRGQPGEPGHCVFYYLDLRYSGEQQKPCGVNLVSQVTASSTTWISDTLENSKSHVGHPGEPGHCVFYYLEVRYAGEHKSRAESD